MTYWVEISFDDLFNLRRLCFVKMRLLQNAPFLLFICFLATGDGLGEGYGMLGQAGSGKLRVSVGQSKLAAKVAKK